MDKRQLLESLLGEGLVNVAFEAAYPGVVVPRFTSCRQCEGLILFVYGHNLPTPIRDLRVDTAGIQATLSFPEGLSSTFVPWGAIEILHTGSFRAQWLRERQPTKTKRPALKLVN